MPRENYIKGRRGWRPMTDDENRERLATQRASYAKVKEVFQDLRYKENRGRAKLTDEEKRQRKNECTARYNKIVYRSASGGGNVSLPIARAIPDPETIAERDRALSAAQSLTARLCGDPPHGRSALDRKQGVTL